MILLYNDPFGLERFAGKLDSSEQSIAENQSTPDVTKEDDRNTALDNLMKTSGFNIEDLLLRVD